MSQKQGDFQSKTRKPGGKFGGKGKGGGFGGARSGGKDGGRGFKKDFQGDKPRYGRSRDGESAGRSEGFRPRKSFARDGEGGGEGRSYDRKPRRDDGDGYKPRRDFGDRPRSSDRPRSDRPYGDRKPRREGSGEGRSYDRKPRGDFGDRPRSSDRPRSDRPYGDRKPRRDGDSFKPRGDFGDRPRSDRPYGDRKPRRDGDFKPRRDGDSFKPRRDGDDRKRSFSDRKSRFDEKPRDDFNDKPKRGDTDDKRSPRHANRFESGGKSFRRYEEKSDEGMDDDEDDDTVYTIANPEQTKAKLKSDRGSFGAPSSAFLFGVHAVTQALKNPKRVHQRLLCTKKGYESVAKTIAALTDEGFKMPQVIYVEKEDIERLLPHSAVHQDLLLDCQPLEDIDLEDIIAAAPDNAKIVVLDQVTDPHNVGAIIRSAAAFGAHAVVVQKLNAPDITGTLAKSASGAVEHVPFVRETNLSRALEKLKEAGFFCVGLAEEGKRTISAIGLSGKVALVLGAEGDGLRRLVAENCDELAKLPTQGEIGSLNVSNAAAVALYELSR